MSSRVLVAGCGYVGRELARMLVADGDTVFALSRGGGDVEGATPVRADLTRPESLEQLPQDCDALVFTAASDESSDDAYRAIYVEGLRNLIRAACARPGPPKRLVVTTSTGVYGQSNGEMVDEASTTRPTRFSGRRLLESEDVAAEAPCTSVVLRLGGIYGPGRTRMIDEVRGGRAVFSPGVAYTNRIHRDDCAGVLRHLLQHPQPAAVYIGVDHDPADRNDVIRWMCERFGTALPSRSEHDVASPTGKRCSNARLLSTGYRFRYPTFREGYGALIDETGLCTSDEQPR